MKKSISVFFILSISVFILMAQIPQGFNYQAIASDPQGNALTETSLTVRIGILKGNEVVWQEDHEIKTSSTGFFSLIIGDESASKTGGSASQFSDIPWGSDDFSLKLSINSGSGFVAMDAEPIMSVPYALYAENGTSGSGEGWNIDTDTIYTSSSVAIGTAYPNQSLLSVQSNDPQVEKPLFEVKNDAGVPVFAVFNDGVMVYVDENKKGVKGGFAVGGYSSAAKGVSQEYLRITPDSVRIWVPESSVTKGSKGGFAVGGYSSASKATSKNFFEVTSSSTNIYFDTTGAAKGVKGGFAVGGYKSGKAYSVNDLLSITPDSTRVYVNTSPAKGVKGGFAVGGYNSGKGADGVFMSLDKENYFIGNNSGSNITTGLYNSVIGYESGVNITGGNSNAFLGYKSGYSNTEGSGNLFLGYQTGYSNIYGNNNTFLGNSAGYNNNGFNNTFLGSFAGYNNVSGGLNTFVGDSTGFLNSGGYSNTFIGTSAGLNNTIGYSNVMLGNRAGYKNSTGSFNVFIGHESGASNNEGGSNVFVGDSTGYSNTNGYSNTFLGAYAGANNTSGFSNLMLGTSAGFSNTTGGLNVFLGHESGSSNIDGGVNVFVGLQAGQKNVSGSANIYLGMNSGREGIDGEGNVYIGYESGKNNIHGKQNVFIGNRAGSGSQGSGKLFISNQEADSSKSLIWGDFYGPFLRFNSFVAIGMQPEYNPMSIYRKDGAGAVSVYGNGDGYIFSVLNLKADTTDKKNNISLQHTIADGFRIQRQKGDNFNSMFAIDSSGNAAINAYPGNHSLQVNDKNSSSSLALTGVGDDYDYAVITLETSGLPVNKNYTIKHGKDNAFTIAYWDGVDFLPRLNISDQGFLSVNSWGATEALDVEGNARFRNIGSGTFAFDLSITADGTLTTSTSDERLKSNIEPLVNSLEKVLQMEGVSYNWKTDKEGKKDAGLLAQDVAEVFPEAVFVNPNDGYYGINYSRFPALFVEAFKEQQLIIDNQKNEIDDLKTRLEKLESIVLEK